MEGSSRSQLSHGLVCQTKSLRQRVAEDLRQRLSGCVQTADRPAVLTLKRQEVEHNLSEVPPESPSGAQQVDRACDALEGRGGED